MTTHHPDDVKGSAMTDEPIVDAEIVPDQPPAASRELARRERRSEVLRPLDADALTESFAAYQALLPRLLEPSDYQAAGDKRFVKKSGWRKIATAFDLDVIIVAEEVERDAGGQPARAKVIARAIAPSGRTMDGDGYCAVTESRFTSARADLSKLENDLRATATTRAKNRAIADLVGMGEVSAEEVSFEPTNASLPHGPAYAEDIGRTAGAACVRLAGGDPRAGVALWKRITAELGYMPHAVAVALILAVDPPSADESES